MKKIIIVVVVLVLLGGAIWTWRYYFEEAEIKWREYILEEITQDFQSLDFMDRRLIGVRGDGQRDVIIESIKDLMGWEKLPGEAGHYPRKVSFPRYSNKIFFAKHLAGTGHSEGLFMLDINSLEFRELSKVGSIYENYYNYLSIVSPDGFKIASLGWDKLYLLDLLRDEIEVLAEKEVGTVFYVAQEVPDFIWLDDYTIQFPIFSAERIYDPPIELRQLSIKVKDIEKPIEDETADWQIYRDELNRYEIKHPEGAIPRRVSPYTRSRQEYVVVVELTPLETMTDIWHKSFEIIMWRDYNECSMKLFEEDFGLEFEEGGSINIDNIVFNEAMAKLGPDSYIVDSSKYYTKLGEQCIVLWHYIVPLEGSPTPLPAFNQEEENLVFKQMLSTFRFLE